MRTVLLALVVATVCGCPPTDTNAQKSDGAANATDPKGPCTRFGQTCEVSPGKLGTCVQKDECTGAACFVCQSQH